MATLILHIGAHKTGSSALQVALRNNKGKLLSAGWAFCALPRRPLNWGHVFSFSPVPDGVVFGLKEGPYRTLLRVLRGVEGDAILSAEDLYFLDDADIARLATDLGQIFSQIRIVAYVRRQDLMAVSQKAQGAKSIQAALLFGIEDTPLPDLTPCMFDYLDYAGRLSKWKRHFAGADMVIGNYDRSGLTDQDIVADFVALNDIGVRLRAKADINVAFGGTTARFYHYLRRAGFPQPAIKKIRQSQLVANSTDSFLPTQDEARGFYETFSDSNRALGQMAGKSPFFNDRFDMLPKTRTMNPLDATYVQDTLVNLLRAAVSADQVAS